MDELWSAVGGSMRDVVRAAARSGAILRWRAARWALRIRAFLDTGLRRLGFSRQYLHTEFCPARASGTLEDCTCRVRDPSRRTLGP